MKVAVVFSCLFALAFGAQIMTKNMDHLDYEWQAWKSKYGKTYYETDEETIRRFIWEKNLRFVDQHNKEAREGKHTYTVAMNKFADLESEEFADLFLRRQNRDRTFECKKQSVYDFNYVSPPTTVDWRTKGFVTPVKDQGQCGSCWAFSTTGSVEGQHFKATGKLVSLSEQNLMDCSKPEGDFSCGGGMMDNAFDYIIANGGIDTEASYPYEEKDESNCRFTKANIGAKISDCVDVTSGDEDALLKAVADVGPISVAIDASRQSFHLYNSGVYSEPTCSSTFLDHGVLAVGYGTESGKDYWLVKNSWGAEWGMEGYIMMSRNANNQCGIATSASYPIV